MKNNSLATSNSWFVSFRKRLFLFPAFIMLPFLLLFGACGSNETAERKGKDKEDEKVKLRYHLVKGSKYRYLIKTESTSKTNIDSENESLNRESQSDFSSDTYLSFIVEDKDGKGNFGFSVYVERIITRGKSGTTDFTYDSDDMESIPDSVKTTLEKMMLNDTKLAISSTGQRLENHSFEESDTTFDMPGFDRDSGEESADPGEDRNISPEGVESSQLNKVMNALLLPFPKDNLEPNIQWSHTNKYLIQEGFDIDLRNDYALSEFDDDSATVTLSFVGANINLEEINNSSDNPPASFLSNYEVDALEINGYGRFEVDIKTGLLIEGSFVEESRLVFRPRNNNLFRSAEVSSNTETTVTRLEDN